MNSVPVPTSNLVDRTSAVGDPKLMAFEMEVEGHHPGYVRHFAETWVTHAIPGTVHFVVTPRFFELHPDVVADVRQLESPAVSISAISAADDARMERISYLRYFHAWKYFCEHLRRGSADHGLLMYSDFFQLPSLLGRKAPVPYSAIYFRPTFHYATLRNYPSTFKEKLRTARKWQLLQRVLQDRQLRHLYCLDEIAASYIRTHASTHVDVRPIADSFTRYPPAEDRKAKLRRDLRIEPGRRVFCLLGVLDRRKGVRQMLESLREIEPQSAARTCILLLGKLQASQREEMRDLIRTLQGELQVQIILRDEYLPDSDIQHYYELSDVILATYQGHMGSSSALIRAALAGKPVMSADYGLMGELVHRRRLGMTLDTGSPAAMARGFERFVESDPRLMFDAQEALRFAQENSAERLAHDLTAMITAERPLCTETTA